MGHFTLDNTANNETAMEKLTQILLQECEFVFDPNESHICCFPHIMNICIQHTIDKYTNADFTDVASQWFNALGQPIEKTGYVRAVRRNPIELGRECVWALRASGHRWANFHQTIEHGNENQSFTTSDGESVTLPVVQLLQDVKTCWDSTYFMINHLRTLHQVC